MLLRGLVTEDGCFPLWYWKNVSLRAGVCALVQLCVCAQSSKSPRPWDWEAGTTHVQTCSPSHMFPLQDAGAKFFSFSSNITGHQYLITPGPNQKINSLNRGPAQWHVWLCVNVSALCMNNLPPYLTPPPPPSSQPTHTPYCSHLSTVPSDTLTNLSVIKPSAYFIKVDESTVSDVLSHW